MLVQVVCEGQSTLCSSCIIGGPWNRIVVTHFCPQLKIKSTKPRPPWQRDKCPRCATTATQGHSMLQGYDTDPVCAKSHPCFPIYSFFKLYFPEFPNFNVSMVQGLGCLLSKFKLMWAKLERFWKDFAKRFNKINQVNITTVKKVLWFSCLTDYFWTTV